MMRILPPTGVFLQCGPDIMLSTKTAIGAMPTITATFAAARTMKIMTTSLDGGWLPRQQWLRRGGGGGGGRSDDGRSRHQSTKNSSRCGKTGGGIGSRGSC